MPAQFTKERPPINFTKAHYDIAVAEEPRLAKLPRSKGQLEIFDTNESMHNSIGLHDYTRALTDWTHHDKAQLGLHVCTFADGTLVTLIWLHTLLDAMGRSAILKAWTAVLEGREEDVPEFFGYDFDPLARLGAAPDKVAANGSETPKIEDSVLQKHVVSGLSFARFAFNVIWEVVWYPKHHGSVMCIPPSYFSKLRSRALSDLSTLDPSLLTLNTKTGEPFLSDGDILMAFATQLLTRSNPSLTTASAATRTLHLMNVFGMRDILSTSSDGFAPLLPKDKVHIANCASAISSLLPLGDFLAMPLGHIAARIRRDLTIQGTRAQMEASQRLSRANDGTYVHTLFGTGDMALSAFTNWAKAKMFDMDFSAAVVREAEVRKEQGARGKAVMIHPGSTLARGFSVRGSGNCIGMDAQGNYWLGFMLREGFEGNLEALVEEMRREEYGGSEQP